jgi:hypothetical protein
VPEHIVGAQYSLDFFSFPSFLVFFQAFSPSLFPQRLVRGNVHICFGLPWAAPFTVQCFQSTFVGFKISYPNMFSHSLCWATTLSSQSPCLFSPLSEKLHQEIPICFNWLGLPSFFKPMKQLLRTS